MIATLEPISVSKLLGISPVNNVLLVKKVESGLSFASLERVGKFSGLPLESLRTVIRISPRTLTRRRQEKRLSPEESDRLVAFSRLISLAFDLFDGDRNAAMLWFNSPNAALGKQSPLEIAATETGTREVENLIGRLEHGVFN